MDPVGPREFQKERLRALLREKRISQRKLAIAIHVHPSAVTRWLKGEKGEAPSAENLVGICLALDTTIHYLYGRDGPGQRVLLAQMARHTVGAPEATIIEAMGRLSDEQRSLLSGRALDWIDGAAPQRFPVDDDEDALKK